MRPRQKQEKLVPHDHRSLQARLRFRRDQRGPDVQPPGQHFLPDMGRTMTGDHQLHFRKGTGKIGGQAIKQDLSQPVRNPEVQPAPVAAVSLVHRPQQVVVFPDQLLSPFKKHPSHIGRLTALVPLDKQLGPQLLLQMLDRLAQGGLGEIELLGRIGLGAAFDDLNHLHQRSDVPLSSASRSLDFVIIPQMRPVWKDLHTLQRYLPQSPAAQGL